MGKGRWVCEEVRGRYGRVYGVSVGKGVGLWGRWGRGMEGLGEGRKRYGGCEEVWGNVWVSVGGCRKVCWGEGVGKCVGVWESYD